MATVRSAFVLVAITLALVLGAVDARAQTVYFSNLTGHQVLTVNGSTGGTPAIVLSTTSTNATFTPEDLVVGPDGKLYICDVGNSLIWRYDPATGHALAIVDFGAAVKAATGQSGVVPVGPTFSGSDDLYVNTRTSVGGSAAGVWVIRGVASQPPSNSYTPAWVVNSPSTVGQGMVVEAFGQLLIVDQANNRVLATKAQNGLFSTTPATLVTNVPAPVGIATNTCGDVLVATGTTIQRYVLAKDASNTLTVASQNTYFPFPKGDVVMYFERDAGNNLYVATNSSSAGGKVWKIAPGNSSDPIASCSTGVAASPAPLVTLKKFTTGSTPLLLSSQMQAVGLAIPATNAIVAKQFAPNQPSNTYNFGHYSLTVTYKQVFNAFTQRFTAIMSRPSDVTFDNSGTTPPFPAGTVGMRFPSLGGYVIQFYTDATQQAPGYFAASTTTDPAFTLTLAFHDPLQGFQNPGLAHAHDPASGPGTSSYFENVTNDFWVLFDQATRGSGSNWGSRYVPFDSPLKSGLVYPLHVAINQPALDGNPLFNLGQNFAVSITVIDDAGQPVPGLLLRVSAARLDPLPIELQVVESNNASTGNVLTDNGNGKYSIGIDTSVFTGGPGSYQFTIFGQGFSPLAFTRQFQK